MRAQMFKTNPTEPATLTFDPNNPWVSESDSGIVDEPFEFDIDNELLIDTNELSLVQPIREDVTYNTFRGRYKDQRVSVKVLVDCQAVCKEKFQKEVLLLSKMNHDSIAKFVGVVIGPELMIVTELIEGDTLRKFLLRCRPHPLDLDMALCYALDIARAMEHLHANGIIHRDLRPHNILMTRDLGQVKLGNLEIAREEPADRMMTSEAGSYRYMAPDAFSREPLRVGEPFHYTHKIDVYSFAIVLWQMLTNRIPFEDKLQDILVPYFVSQNERPSLLEIPDEAKYLLEACWAEDPNHRPEFKDIVVYLTKMVATFYPNDDGMGDSRRSESPPPPPPPPNVPSGVETEDDFNPRAPVSHHQKKRKDTKFMKWVVLPLFKIFAGCVSK